MTATLSIDRFDVRYHGVRPGEAERLDRALARLVETELARATDRRIPATELEICIPDLCVAIEIAELHDLGLVARRWADEVAEAIARRSDSHAGVVAYRHRLDALLDFATSVIEGDFQRVWAWQQIGLVGGEVSVPTTEHVTRSLLAHPAMVPAVMRRLATTTELRLSVSQWLRLAGTVARALGPLSSGSGTAPPRRRGPWGAREAALARQLPWALVDPDEQLLFGRLVLASSAPELSASRHFVEELTRRWVDRASTAAPGSKDPDRAKRESAASGPREEDICLSGGSARPSSRIDDDQRPPGGDHRPEADSRPAIGDSGPPSEDDDRGTPPSADDRSAREPETAAREPSSPVEAGDVPDRTRPFAHPTVAVDDEPESGPPAIDPGAAPVPAALGRSCADGSGHRSVDGSSDPALETSLREEPIPTAPEGSPTAHISDHGGVVFMPHCLRAIGLVERIVDTELRVGPSSLLAHALAAASGADPTDPAVLTMSGCDPTEGVEDLPTEAVAAAAGWGHEIITWTRERLGLGDDDGLAWFWSRRAEIRVEPGWIDVDLALDGVDLRIRSAGLDLDPGFVWWLGSVVRYRYA